MTRLLGRDNSSVSNTGDLENGQLSSCLAAYLSQDIQQGEEKHLCFSTRLGQAVTFLGARGSKAEAPTVSLPSSLVLGNFQWAIKIYNPNGLKIVSLRNQVQIKSAQAFSPSRDHIFSLEQVLFDTQNFSSYRASSKHLWLQSPSKIQ